MINVFWGAAFPWILLGLFVAISCSLMSKKNKFQFVKLTLEDIFKDYDGEICSRGI